MGQPAFVRLCCDRKMELVRRYPDGNELVECRVCGLREEIATSGYSVRPLRDVAQATETADLMAEIMAGIPAA